MNLYKFKNKSTHSSTMYRFSAGHDDLEVISQEEPPDKPSPTELVEELVEAKEEKKDIAVGSDLPEVDITSPPIPPLKEKDETSSSDQEPSPNISFLDASPTHGTLPRSLRRSTDSVLSKLKGRLSKTMAEKLEKLSRDKKCSLIDVDEPVSEYSFLRQSGSEPSICDVGGTLVDEGEECKDDADTEPIYKPSQHKAPVTSITLSSLRDLDYEHHTSQDFPKEELSPATETKEITKKEAPPNEESSAVLQTFSEPSSSFQPHAHFIDMKHMFLIIIGLLAGYFSLYPPEQFGLGFLSGSFITSILASFLWWLFKPRTRIVYSYPKVSNLPTLSIPFVARGNENPDVYQGWMNELGSKYDPDTFLMSETFSIHVTLNKTSLQLSRPKANIPRRAMWNEPVHKPIYVQKRFYNISSASVTLLPAGLSNKRRWNRRYPICLSIPPIPNPLDSNMEPASSVEILLFARTDREKEEWFRRFEHAIVHGGASGLHQQKECGEISDGELRLLQHLVTDEVPFSRQVEFTRYMVELLHRSQGEGTEGQLAWLNVMVGRLLFNILTHQQWKNHIRRKIQSKFNKLKLPDVVEELRVVEVDLGTSLPSILRVSEPLIDDRGFWLDLDMLYDGTASIKLEIKVNLIKSSSSKPAGSSPGTPVPPSKESNNSEDIPLGAEDETSDSSSDDFSGPDSGRNSPEMGGQTKLVRIVDRITKSQYFQHAVENNRYIKRAAAGVSNTRLVMQAEVRFMHGTLTLNIPPHPSDRLWYGFRGVPSLDLRVSPMLGSYKVKNDTIIEMIENRLRGEIQKIIVLPNMDDIILPFLSHGHSRHGPS